MYGYGQPMDGGAAQTGYAPPQQPMSGGYGQQPPLYPEPSPPSLADAVRAFYVPGRDGVIMLRP